MKIKSIQAKQFMDTYSNFLKQEIPIKIAFKLNKIYNSIKNDYDFYNDQIRKIIMDYSEKKENGEIEFTSTGDIKIQEDKIEECNSKFLELDELEFEAPDNIKFSINDFSDLKIELSLIEGLMPFIEE